MPKVISFFGLLLATVGAMLLARFAGMPFTGTQILSVTIFSMFIIGTLLFGEFRLAFAFAGIALLLGLNLMDLPQFVQSANLKVIIFLVGMFIIIGFLEEHQFFEHIVSRIVRMIGPRPTWLLPALMILASLSAAMVDEVTSILFMTGTMLHLTGKYKLNPTPFILMLVFATNIGSSMSAIGNPIGVMIALNAGFSFAEFVRWSAPIAILANILTYMICRWWFAEPIKAFENAVQTEHDAAVALKVGKAAAIEPDGIPDDSPLDDGHFQTDGPSNMIDGLDVGTTRVVCWVVFLGTILMLCCHGLLEQYLGRIMGAVRETLPDGTPVYGLKEGTMMVGASLFMAAVVMLIRRGKARELVERRVDWWTLSFFMMLFASVGTLEHTGVTRVVAERMISATGDSPFLLISLVGWATGWLSAFLDNVLAVATFMPVVHDVRTSWAAANPTNPGYPEAIYWMMLFGGTFMGNMTVIGSTANIIAAGMLEKRGHGVIRFGEWFRIGFIVSIATMLLATVLLGVQTDWFTQPLIAPPVGEAIGGH